MFESNSHATSLGARYYSDPQCLKRSKARDRLLAARARREYVQGTWLAASSAALGRMDEAFALLERACDEHDGILVYSRRYPFFALFQSDPRMDQIYRRIGFPHAPTAASPAPKRPRRDRPERRSRA